MNSRSTKGNLSQSLAYLFLLIGCMTCSAATGQTLNYPRVDTSKYAILAYDKWVEMAMDNKFDNPKPATLSAAEVDGMEDLIDSAYRLYNLNRQHRQLITPLARYRRQYVAVINPKGQKEVWVNFFCSDFTMDWRHQAVVVDDGGVCFFQLVVNLSSRKISKPIPNGVAGIQRLDLVDSEKVMATASQLIVKE